MTSTFSYTVEYETDSSFIDGVYYDENNATAVVDVGGEYYRYHNVPRTAVTDLVNANSVGAHYNTYFKRAYGPGEDLGRWADVTEILVSANNSGAGVPKDLTSAAANAAAATKEYSLKTPAPAPAAPKVGNELVVKSVVYFTLDGVDNKVFEFPSNKDSLVDAISELDDYVSRLGSKGKVSKVVFEFV